jgi:hypothetical protein
MVVVGVVDVVYGEFLLERSGAELNVVGQEDPEMEAGVEAAVRGRGS